MNDTKMKSDQMNQTAGSKCNQFENRTKKEE